MTKSEKVRSKYILTRVPRHGTGTLCPLSWLRCALGMLFFLAGTLKLLAPLFYPGLSFSAVLGAVGTPWPEILAWLVIGTELICGIGLFWFRVSQLASLPLLVNLAVAVYLVGLPGFFHGPLFVHGMPVGGEWWRLPLELLLMVGLTIVLWTGPYTLPRVPPGQSRRSNGQ